MSEIQTSIFRQANNHKTGEVGILKYRVQSAADTLIMLLIPFLSNNIYFLFC